MKTLILSLAVLGTLALLATWQVRKAVKDSLKTHGIYNDLLAKS